MEKYRICGGSLVLENAVMQRDLLVADGVIQGIIEPEDPTPAGYRELDAKECFVSAGFVDIHQHGGGGSDYMDAEPDSILNATNAHLAHGCTSVMPTFLSADIEGTLKAVESYLQALEDPRIQANLLGIHLEGRYISPAQAGAQKPERIRPYDRGEYETIGKAAKGHLRRWSCAPEVEGAEEFAAFAAENGIVLSIAHTDADMDTVTRAFDWGYRHVTHLYSCMSTITRKGGFRVPGALEAAYYLDDMDVEIIADGCHVPHSLLRYAVKFKGCDHICLITDAMRAAGQDVAESYLGSKDDPLPVVVEDGVAKMLDRKAFAGSVATCDRLVRNMLQAGASLVDAVAMVTVNPLRMMHLEVKKGKLQPGYDADICIFDRDIHIQKVLCKGNVVI
jgi:N-acetylglucosamine-6-phosphate deacetylase